MSRSTFARALVLLCGTLLASGRRTMAAVLRAVGLAEDPHVGADHRVLSRAGARARVVTPPTLGRLLLGLVVARLLPADQPVRLLDETLERRMGRRIAYEGRFWDRVPGHGWRSRGPQAVICVGLAAMGLGHACRRAGVTLVTRCRLAITLHDPPAPKEGSLDKGKIKYIQAA